MISGSIGNRTKIEEVSPERFYVYVYLLGSEYWKEGWHFDGSFETKQEAIDFCHKELSSVPEEE